MSKFNIVKEWINAPIKNKVAVIILLSVYPLSIVAQGFILIGTKLEDFGEFVLIWMEYWTGLRSKRK